MRNLVDIDAAKRDFLKLTQHEPLRAALFSGALQDEEHQVDAVTEALIDLNMFFVQDSPEDIRERAKLFSLMLDRIDFQ